MIEEAGDDPDLSDDQRLIVRNLSAADVEAIDQALLTQITERWRKVAFIVAKAMAAFGEDRVRGVPDIYYAERVRLLADRGLIESVGNLRRMRFSEVRRPTGGSACRA